MSQITFNSHRNKLTSEDIKELFELLSYRLRAHNKQLMWTRLTDHLSLIPHAGILDRLKKDKYGWTYCAGQSYPEEFATVREIILKCK